MAGATVFTRSSTVAAALAAMAAGVIASAPQANAADCTDWVFPQMTIRLMISSGDVLTFGGGTPKDIVGPGNWSNNAKFWDGAVSAHITDGNKLNVNFTDSEVSWDLVGVIDAQGVATGSVTSIPGATFQGSDPFVCNETAPSEPAPEEAATPAQGPTVTFNPIIGGLRVTVADRSGVASQCVYSADNGFTRSFGLGANATTNIDIVPALPELRDWAVSVECDNGTRTDVTTFF